MTVVDYRQESRSATNVRFGKEVRFGKTGNRKMSFA